VARGHASTGAERSQTQYVGDHRAGRASGATAPEQIAAVIQQRGLKKEAVVVKNLLATLPSVA
jgi:hypothetical protein